MLFKVARLDGDSYAIATRYAEKGFEIRQPFDLVRQDDSIYELLRLEVDAFPKGINARKLRHTHFLDFALAQEFAGPFGHFGFIDSENQLCGGRAEQGDGAVVPIDFSQLADRLHA